MSSNTPNLGLLKKDPMVDGNETFNIETMLNENWDKVDEAVGQVREELGNIDVDIPEASLTEKGIVQLSSATNGTRENVAATEKAVKEAYDEALAGKQLGVEQKANVVAALNSVGVAASTSETWAQLVAKMAGIIKATGNATAGDVLAGRTFSNGSGNNLAGTMPNKGSVTLIPGPSDQAIPAGYHNGSGKILGISIPTDKVLAGTSIAGTAGTMPNLGGANITSSFVDVVQINGGYRDGTGKVLPPVPQGGNTPFLRYITMNYIVNNYNYTKYRTVRVNVSGVYRLTFTANSYNYGDNGYGRIYKNGVAFGLERYVNSTSQITFTEDLSAQAGDTLEFWFKSTNGSIALQEMSVYFNIPQYVNFE
ncbi:phage tail protein [Yersinia pestis]|nr:phage tail protein [Yersinia pestis]